MNSFVAALRWRNTRTVEEQVHRFVLTLQVDDEEPERIVVEFSCSEFNPVLGSGKMTKLAALVAKAISGT